MTPMPPLPQEQLDTVKDAEAVEWSPSRNHWLEKGRAEQLAAVLRDNHRLKEFSITTQVDDDALRILAEALRDHPSLTSFRLKHQNGLSMDTLRAVTDTCFDLPQLEYFQLKGVDLSPVEIRHVAERATAHPSLGGLCLSKNRIDDVTASSLADMLDKKRNFQYIRLMDCDLSDESMVLLASRAAKQPDMIHFHLHYNPFSGKAAEAVPRLMLEGGGLNLISCLPYNEQSNRYCTDNAALVKQLVETLAQAQSQDRSEDILTHAQAVARMPAMRHTRRISSEEGPSAWELANAYLQQLPELDDSNDILRTNDRGQCPAENPRLWQNAETTLQRLEQAGITIDANWLAQKTARGDSLLACALTADAEAVIPALNKRDIRIQAEALLDNNGQPNEVLQNVIRQNTCGALFQHENWRGAGADSARAVLYALPDTTRQRLGNTYQLLTRLTSEQRHTGHGR